MIGKRVNVAKHSPDYLCDCIPDLKPLEYGKDCRGRWWCYPPNDSGLCLLTGHGVRRDWNVVENADSTITVSPSIRIMSDENGKPDRWHGYLINGEWKEC